MIFLLRSNQRIENPSVTVIEESVGFFVCPFARSSPPWELLWFSPNSLVFMGSKWGMKIAGYPYNSTLLWTWRKFQVSENQRSLSFFVYSSPFFIVLFLACFSIFFSLLSFPEFRKMLKMSSFFKACQGLLPRKKFHPKQLFSIFFPLLRLWNDHNELWEEMMR